MMDGLLGYFKENEEDRNFFNYYAMNPFSHDSYAVDNRILLITGSFLSCFVLYPVILGALTLAEGIYRSLAGRVKEGFDKEVSHRVSNVATVITSGETKSETIQPQTQDQPKLPVDLEINSKEQFKKVKEIADRGDKEAQYRVGLEYGWGIFTAKDNPTALEYYKKAAEQGHREAQYKVAFIYEFGDKTLQNNEQAFKYYKLAADQGHTLAEYNVAMMYGSGKGVAQSDDKAFEYYKIAADHGEHNSQFKVGWRYQKGLGTQVNIDKALNYYKLAAEQGNVLAQFELGSIYYFGIQLPKNLSEAYKYYKLAADQGFKIATNMLENWEQKSH